MHGCVRYCALNLRLPKLGQKLKPGYEGSVIAAVQLAIVFDAEVRNVSEKYEVAIEDFKPKSQVIPFGFDHSSEYANTWSFVTATDDEISSSVDRLYFPERSDELDSIDLTSGDSERLKELASDALVGG